MAFYNYNSTFSHSDFSEYEYDYDSYDSITYDHYQDSSYEPTFQNLFDYPSPPFYDSNSHGAYDSASNFNDPYYYHGDYDSSISFTANACSASTFTLPKVIEYDPDFFSQKVSTQFITSYSVAEFNEPDFEEYDPTPYGGGYDISQTYGKPLPPSNEICYPSSSSAPKAPSLNDASSKGSTEMKNGKEEKADQEAAKGKIDEKVKTFDEIKPTQNQIHEENNEKRKGDSGKPDLGSGYENGRGNHDYGRAVNQFPSGYGLESLDLCETLFGYWPCLSRIKTQTDCRHEHYCQQNGHGDQWQTAADYLFGSCNPYQYGQTRDGRSQGDAAATVNRYERHSQEGDLFGQIGYAENSWLNEFN